MAGFCHNNLPYSFQHPEMGAVFMPQFVEYTGRLWYDERKIFRGNELWQDGMTY